MHYTEEWEKRQRAGVDGSDRWNNFAEARDPGGRIHQPLQQTRRNHSSTESH